MKVAVILSIFLGLIIGAGVYGGVQYLVNPPTSIPESEWYCLKGKVETFSRENSYGTTSMSIIGDQLICARDWKVSSMFGPIGFLDDHPEQIITFGDLQNLGKSPD